MDIFITIVIVIVLLGILIGCHELGHLFVAKAFNVYCLEYSIGFGPKIASKRRKGGETYYSLRAIPFGGYVSMYGEGVELDEGVSCPKERSLEGISHPRQALIMGAGITVNVLLSVVFAFIYVTCFPQSYTSAAFSTGVGPDGTHIVASEGAYNAYMLNVEGELFGYEISPDEHLYSPTYFTVDEVDAGTTVQRAYFLIDGSAVVGENECVALYRIESTSGSNDFLSNIRFFQKEEGVFLTAGEETIGITSMPDLEHPVSLEGEGEVTFELSFVSVGADGEATFGSRRSLELSGAYRGGSLDFDGVGLWTSSLDIWRSFSEAMQAFCELYVQFFVMIGQGLAQLFTLNLEGLGSIVMMGSQMNVLTRTIGIGQTFFWYGSALSLNLAIFNLLPIPGLDGWQLLVTTVEGTTKKRIPDKIKTIVSYIGLGLLLVLFVLLIVKDVLQVAGIA